EEGQVSLGGRTLLDTANGTNVPPERRRLAYVAQRDALFEHLDVAANIGFALGDLSESKRRSRVAELITWFGLGQVRGADPRTLSGGERQRVAFARALAASPDALLLDEPFSALDTVVRQGLRTLVREIHQRTGLPIVLVTHDHSDVFELADVVVVLENGRVAQQGTVEEVFARPASRSVAELLGIPNVLAVHSLRQVGTGQALTTTDWGELLVPTPGTAGSLWELAVPSDAVGLDSEGEGAWIESVRAAPGGLRVRIRRTADGATLEALLPRRAVTGRLGEGLTCGVTIDGSHCHLMPGREQAAADQVMACATSS
ncbi:MAG TPA: ABC transporter ATP-binding protein, partial [Chloroflexota bacterium]|nr:ABC transporter ATP-binding protein [Chloroflexota bacterium]